MKASYSGVTHRSQAGVTMIEVLIAVLVLAIGLLGMAAMQMQAVKLNHSAYLRTQASVLAYDISDRIRANDDLAIAGRYDRALDAAIPTATDLPSQDIAQWVDNIRTTLPSGNGSIVRNGRVFTITVQFNDSRGSEAVQAFVTRMSL